MFLSCGLCLSQLVLLEMMFTNKNVLFIMLSTKFYMSFSSDGIKALHKGSFSSYMMPLSGREGIFICNGIVEGCAV